MVGGVSFLSGRGGGVVASSLGDADCQLGVMGLEVGVVGLQRGVAVLQVQDVGDAGEVDAIGGEFGDASQAGEVVVAVATGAAFGARWGE
ncbi:MAG: hypothetical protein JWR37_5892 [Mycobacterium sp.]|nr:hypothetical protein [Mycobacterium sp.]